jgi:hypothetical protein
MFNGLWTVEFTSTINRYGRGVLVLNKNRLLGGDDGYYYSGTLNITGNKINATIEVLRYDENSISIFGNISHFHLNINGVIDEYQFRAIGTIADKPQIEIKVIGTKREDL